MINRFWKKVKHVYKEIVIFISIICWLQDLVIDGKLEKIGLILLILSIILIYFYLIYVLTSKKASLLTDVEKVHTYTKKQRRIARIALFFTTSLLILFLSWKLIRFYSSPNKALILVADIKGPNSDNYRISDLILKELRKEVKSSDFIKIKFLNEEINEKQGSEYANKIGEKEKAAIVIWGWYGITNNKGYIRIKFEDLHHNTYKIKEKDYDKFDGSLKSNGLIDFIESNDYTFDISEFDEYKLQNDLANSVSSITNTIIGILYHNQRKYEDAITFFNKALNNGRSILLPDNRAVYYYLGNTYAILEQYDKAINNYNAVIQINRGCSEAYYNRGYCFSQLCEYKNAISDYNNALKINSKFKKALLNRGLSYYYINNYRQALKDYNKALDLDSLDPIAYKNRGDLYRNIKKYDKAKNDLNKAIKLNREFVAAYVSLALLYNEIKENEMALKYLNIVNKIEPNNYIAYNNRGEIYSQQRRYEDAIKEFSKAISINPKSSTPYFNRATIYNKMGNIDSALIDINRAIELDSINPVYFLNRGDIFSDLDSANQAIKDYNLAIKYNENYYQAYNNLGVIYCKLKNYSKATKCFEKVLVLNAEYYEAINNLADINITLDNNNKAIDLCNKAIDIDNKNYHAYYLRAVANYNLKNYNNFKKDIVKCIESNPPKEVEDYLKNLKSKIKT